MSGHTPGPWYVKRNPVTVCVLALNGSYITENVRVLPEQQANADLIAAAPDLLEALKTARHVLAVACGETAPYIHEAFKAIDSAIRKVEGR